MDITKRLCLCCGKPMDAIRGNKKYCSDACKMVDYRNRKKYGTKVVGPEVLLVRGDAVMDNSKRRCYHCGKPMDAIRGDKKYCSDACKMVDYRNRKKYGMEVVGPDGYIYVIQESMSGLCKIGGTRHIDFRLSLIQTDNPHPINLIVSVQVSNWLKIERRLHKIFKSKRIRGEWFSLNEDDINWLKCLNTSGPDAAIINDGQFAFQVR